MGRKRETGGLGGALSGLTRAGFLYRDAEGNIRFTERGEEIKKYMREMDAALEPHLGRSAELAIKGIPHGFDGYQARRFLLRRYANRELAKLALELMVMKKTSGLPNIPDGLLKALLLDCVENKRRITDVSEVYRGIEFSERQPGYS